MYMQRKIKYSTVHLSAKKNNVCVCLQVVRQGLVDPVLHSFHCYHLVQLDLVLQEYHRVPKYYRELNGKRTHFTCMYMYICDSFMTTILNTQ